MKYGSSVDMPPAFVISGGRVQYRFNIRQVTKDRGNGPETYYKYDYVEFPGPVTRKALIDALVRSRFDINDEFKLAALDHSDPEYIAYREWVEESKAIADAALAN